MKLRAGMVLIVVAVALTASLQSQQPAAQPSTALPPPTPREPAWAFQVQMGSLPAEPQEPVTLPGSTRKYLPKEIDNLNSPPDWFPDAHPPAPDVIVKGRPGAPACGSCHLMSGLGHPESADLTGFTTVYFERQMQDFKSGARQDWANRMNAYAKALTDEEIRQAAEYFAALPRQAFVRVVEAEMVPKTFVGQGRMRFVDPAAKGEMEPIGNRIITLPEDQELARRRDPRSGFVAYVPPGSIARGKELAETGAGRTIPCVMCHGERLEGAQDFPRLAGVHPIYTVRQLYQFREGTRNGPDAALMLGPAAGLTDQDILDVAAFAASLPPE